MLLQSMKKLLLCLFTAAACFSAAAQVQVDRRIELTGADDAARQVTGLDTTTAPGQALTAAVAQRGEYRHAVASPGAAWSVQLPSLNDLQAGTHITIAVPGENPAGDAFLQVNGGSLLPVVWAPGVPLDASTVDEGMVLSLVFNGSEWQRMNGIDDRLRPCPPEMSAVNGQFCVDRAQRSSQPFDVAANICAAESKRLCSWGEFIAACQRRTALGLLNPSSDWEWTGDSANEENSVRMVKLANCTSAGTRNMFTPAAPYRCCLTR